MKLTKKENLTTEAGHRFKQRKSNQTRTMQETISDQLIQVFLDQVFKSFNFTINYLLFSL